MNTKGNFDAKGVFRQKFDRGITRIPERSSLVNYLLRHPRKVNRIVKSDNKQEKEKGEKDTQKWVIWKIAAVPLYCSDCAKKIIYVAQTVVNCGCYDTPNKHKGRAIWSSKSPWGVQFGCNLTNLTLTFGPTDMQVVWG